MGIKLKRSAVASKAPLIADLELGELAVNTWDGKLYLRKNDGTDAILEVGPVRSVAGRTGTVTLARADVGLANVDNTSDASKPVSTATLSALNGKAASAHTHTASQVTDLGTAATKNVGISANSVVQLDASARLPAVDGSQLTNLPAPVTTGRLIRTPQVLTSGTSYTTPAGCTQIYVEAVGGGAGGGSSGGSGTGGAQGGGAGAYCARLFAVSANTAYSYAIGSGGSGASQGSGGETNGGNTTFTVGGTTITAGGGNINGNGGTATNGDWNRNGGRGGKGAGFAPSGIAIGGAGGNSMFGDGGPTPGVGGSVDNGNAGVLGGGGSGAADASTGASSFGGAGGAGMIRIWEYS